MATAYLISYDLNKPGQNYDGLYQAIKGASTGVWWHYLDSTWIIKSNSFSADDVFEKLSPYLDKNDRCIVVEIKNNKQGWLTKDAWAYLEENVFN